MTTASAQTAKNTRTISYPDVPTKGPSTLGRARHAAHQNPLRRALYAKQLELLADLCEEYSDGYRPHHYPSGRQLHFIHIEDTPTIHAPSRPPSGITTREALRQSPSATSPPALIAGVRRTQTFDAPALRESRSVPYARPSRRAELRPQIQDRLLRLQRRSLRTRSSPRFRRACHHPRSEWRDSAASSSGSAVDSWPRPPAGPPLRRIRSRRRNPSHLPGDRPRLRRLGEKENRNTARLKFLVSKLGVEEFRRLVKEERAILTPDPRWSSYLEDVACVQRGSPQAASAPADQSRASESSGWIREVAQQ